MTESEQNQLIIEHMDTLVPAIAADFRGGALEFEDLLAVGREGLVKAARSFDEEKSSFSTWASNKIRTEIWGAVRVADIAFFPKEHDAPLPVNYGDHIEKIFEWDCWGERGNGSAICERWSKLDASPEDLASLYEEVEDKRSKFDAAFMSLTGNQRKLVKWVYLADKPMPITDAARELGCSYFQAIRMLKKALKTMREVITRMESKKMISGGNIAKGHPSIAGLHGCAPGSNAA